MTATMGTDRPRRSVSVFGWIAAAIVIYHIIIVGNLAAMAGYFMPSQVHGALSLACALTIIFVMVPAFGSHGMSRGVNMAGRRLTIFDGGLIACA